MKLQVNSREASAHSLRDTLLHFPHEQVIDAVIEPHGLLLHQLLRRVEHLKAVTAA